MNIVSYAINKIRMMGSRYGLTNSAYKVLYYGTICDIGYLNYKHDPHPQIFIMFSGVKYTHGLNIHYMKYEDRQWIGKLIYSIKKGQQRIDGRTLYLLIKSQRPSIVRTCYRKYFTTMIKGTSMVSAGFTPLQKLEFKTTDPFINSLNKYLEPTEMNYSGVKVAYSEDELQERIAIANNAISTGSSAINREAISSTSPGTRPGTTPV